MRILDLPVEIFQAILVQSLRVRTLKRFMRLRLVSKAFAKQIMEVIYVYRIMDEQFSAEGTYLGSNLPPFTASYLEYRVLNHMSDKAPALLTIRKVAETLSQQAVAHGDETKTLEDHVERLCSLVLRDGTSNDRLCHIFDGYDPYGHEFSTHLLVAAVDSHSTAILEQHLADGRRVPGYSWLFGQPFRIAAANGDHEMLKILFRNPPTWPTLSKARGQAFIAAAAAGRVDTVRFIFSLAREEIPWRFEQSAGAYGTYDEPLSSAMTTPSKDVLEFVTYLQQSRSVKKSIWKSESDSLTKRLHSCTAEGWTEMVAHLLELGACPDGLRADTDSNFRPLIRACTQGHVEIVRTLLCHGANTNKALGAAARHGHLEIVQMLLDVGADLTGSISQAAAGGYMNVIQMLLDHGARVEFSRGTIPPLICAIELEHTSMFNLLLAHGADLITPDVAEELYNHAKAEGQESMIALLEEFGTVGAL